MARPRKAERPADTAAELRRTALAHFGRSGFEPTSLSAIAKEVGVTRTTLLYHFESKENLYNAVVQEAFTRVAGELIESMGGDGPLRLRLRRMIERFLAFVEENPHLAKLMIREVIDERGPGCAIIVNQGMPVLELVEAFVLREGGLKASQRGMLREILLQITTSVMLKSASGAMREAFWGVDARTSELAALLLEGLLGLPLRPQ
jgi:AcrR family transcriptional regulator